MFWLFVVGLWAVMLVAPVMLLFFFLPNGRDCPRCSAETLPIRSRLLRPLRRFVRLRWCIGCGWQGITRNATAEQPLPALEVVPEDADESGGDAPWSSNPRA